MKKILVFLGLLATVLPAGAKIVMKSVPYEQGGVKLEGFLAYDDAKTAQGKLPGVLVVHEWWGLNDYVKHRAVMLARLGYVAFAADMYGAGVNTTDPAKARELSSQFYGKPLMAERARAGLDQLLATGLVDENKVAAIGYCFGGAVCQVLAYSGAPLAGVVSFHGSLVPAPAGASNKAKFLICHGALDSFTKPEAVLAFQKSLNEGGFNYEFISYSGAVHAFTNPDSTKLGQKYGLNIAYNAEADHRSWRLMQDFFGELFDGAKKM